MKYYKMIIFCAPDRHMANIRDFLKIMFNKDLMWLVHITYSNCDTLLAAGGTHRELPASVVHRRAPRAIVFLIRGHCLDFPRRQWNNREYPQITRECKVRELSVRTVYLRYMMAAMPPTNTASVFNQCILLQCFQQHQIVI